MIFFLGNSLIVVIKKCHSQSELNINKIALSMNQGVSEVHPETLLFSLTSLCIYYFSFLGEEL